MSNNPKVTVIIPVYNPGVFIHECLRSVLSQGLKEIEVICINDGSTDSSAIILEEYAKNDSRLIVINQENMGQSAARNKGLLHATGDYVFFLDSDDYIAPNSLQLCFQTAQRNNVNVVYFNGKLFFPNGDNFPFWEHWVVKDFSTGYYQIEENDRVAFFTNVCTTLYKRSFLIENNLFFIEKLLYEDLEYNYRVLCHLQDYYWLDNNIYFYRRAVSESTTSRNDESSFDLFKAYEISRKHLVDSSRFEFFEYVVSLNVIRHAYGKFARDIFLSKDDNLKIKYYYALKELCNSFSFFYFESIVNELSPQTIRQLKIIREADFNGYEISEARRNRFRAKVIKWSLSLGIKQDLHAILDHSRIILECIKRVNKALFNISKKIVSKAITSG